MFLYRSGDLPDLETLANTNSVWFDTAGTIPDLCSPRSTSVFATLSYPAAHEWVDWRQSNLLSADIWEIQVPANAILFAYDVRHYENAGYARWRTQKGNPTRISMEEYVQQYWSTRVSVPADIDKIPDHQWWEVLIPYDIAVQASWTLIEQVDPPDWVLEHPEWDVLEPKA